MFLKRNSEAWVKVILIYVVFSFLVDSTLLRLDDTEDKVLIFNILCAYTVVEYSIFTFIIYSIIDKKVFKIVILFLSLIFYFFAIFSFLRAKNYNFDSLTASIEAILIIVYCIFYLFDQLNKPQVMFIYQEPGFWFIVGFLVYCSGTLFLFIQANKIEKELRDIYWNINFSLTITKNILFAVAFSVKKSKTIIKSLENPFDNDFLENPYKY